MSLLSEAMDMSKSEMRRDVADLEHLREVMDKRNRKLFMRCLWAVLFLVVIPVAALFVVWLGLVQVV